MNYLLLDQGHQMMGHRHGHKRQNPQEKGNNPYRPNLHGHQPGHKTRDHKTCYSGHRTWSQLVTGAALDTTVTDLRLNDSHRILQNVFFCTLNTIKT